MTPLTQLPPLNRVELDEHKIDIDLSLEEELVSPAPVADETAETIDISHLTPVIQRPTHPTLLPRQAEPRRSARLAPPTPIPLTTLIEEETPQPEDIKESGTESDSEPPRNYVRGVKSAVVRLDVETGRNKYWYETQWEGYGEEDNTWQLACDFDSNPTTKAMLRTAREGKDASSFAAKTLEQPNQVFSIARAARGYMAKPIDEFFTRSDLIFESVLDSINDPPPARCVSLLATADMKQEYLLCKGTSRRVNHGKFESSASKLKSRLPPPP
jgi:hypothetical protein